MRQRREILWFQHEGMRVFQGHSQQNPGLGGGMGERETMPRPLREVVT